MHVTLKSLKLKIRNDNHNRRRFNSEPDIGRELPVLERYEIVDITGSAFPVIFSMYLHFDNSVLMKEKPNNRNLINGYL